MLGKIKSAARAVADYAGDALGAGVEKLKASLDELSAASGDLEQLGYRVGSIELACTLPPRLILFLSRQGTATPEAYQAILAKHAENKTLRTVIGLLQLADRLAEQVKMQGRRCSQLAVELGLPPSVRLIYEPAPAAPG
jgi:hypothetical protein